jgi:hypothetical protein
MNRANRNLLLLFGHSHHEQSVEQEMECLAELISTIITPEHFCVSFELVDRNSITHRPKKILKYAAQRRLPAFRFFINKN